MNPGDRLERMKQLTAAKYEGEKSKPSVKKKDILPPPATKPKPEKKTKKK